MATPNLQLSFLDVGQREKEAVINYNMQLIDSKVLRFLGAASADPSTTGVSQGSTYFNTSTNKLKVLVGSSWLNAA